MSKTDTSIQTGSALRNFGGMPAIATVVLTMTVAQADGIEGTRLERPIAVMTEPGAIGSNRPPQFGPRLDEVEQYQQPVELRGPKGLLVSVQTNTGWSQPEELPLRIGLLPGRSYRLRVKGVPHRPSDELYQDDLNEAFSGNHVQRVVYVSNEPEASDVLADRWFDIQPGDSCLAVASTLGAPVAELRIGNRLPL